MRLAKRTVATETLLWFGFGGGALAWAAQLVVGSESEENRCTQAGIRIGVDSHAYTMVATALAGAVALAAIGASLYAFREIQRSGGDRRGRFVFLATSGLLANAIFLALILLGGIGSLVLDQCVQG
jgi:hypothetical protein